MVVIRIYKLHDDDDNDDNVTNDMMYLGSFNSVGQLLSVSPV